MSDLVSRDEELNTRDTGGVKRWKTRNIVSVGQIRGFWRR